MSPLADDAGQDAGGKLLLAVHTGFVVGRFRADEKNWFKDPVLRQQGKYLHTIFLKIQGWFGDDYPVSLPFFPSYTTAV